MIKQAIHIFICFLLAIPILSAQDVISVKKSKEIQRIDGIEFYIHKVEKKQTLFSISRTYEVPMEKLIELNPEIREGLKVNMKIKIPVRLSDLDPKPVIQPVSEQQDTVVDEKKPDCRPNEHNRQQTYNIALLLPLNLWSVAGIPTDLPASELNTNYKAFEFITFYEGLRMALDSLEKKGLRARLYVYDADGDTSRIVSLTQKPEMKNMDLIIALLYHNSFRILSRFAKEQHIFLVNPLSERPDIIRDNPYVIKLQPSVASQQMHLSAYINRAFPNTNVIVVGEFKSPLKDQSSIPAFSDVVQSNYNHLDSVLFNKLKLKHTGDPSLHFVNSYYEMVKFLDHQKENLVMHISDNKVSVMDFINRLNDQSRAFRVTLFGLPRWDKLDDLENEHLVNTSAHVMYPAFINYDDPGVIRFIGAYRDIFKTEPDLLAFEGFDIGVLFFSSLMDHGKSFGSCLPQRNIQLLHTTYRFCQSPRNGLENTYWNIVKYMDYQLIKVN